MRRSKKRMTERDIQMVMEEIEAWKNGERGKKLTWGILEKVFPFTRQTLSSKDKIRTMFNSLRKGAKPSKQKKINLYSNNDIELQRLKNENRELKNAIDKLHKLLIEKII